MKVIGLIIYRLLLFVGILIISPLFIFVGIIMAVDALFGAYDPDEYKDLDVYENFDKEIHKSKFDSEDYFYPDDCC